MVRPNKTGRKKRKFQGNRYSKGEKCSDSVAGKRARLEAEEPSSQAASASARKIPLADPKENNESQTQNRSNISGYRFMDMEILANVFEEMPCKECGKCELMFSEDLLKRKGCASLLRVICQSCGWKHCFYTSGKVKHYFVVNRRLVYGMRTTGQGPASAKRFMAIMNMPPPPKPKAYTNHNKALLKVAEKVSSDTMAEASGEVHGIKGEDKDGMSNCGVSCDGTWQRRGYSSLNGCVTALSIDTGKCLDVEVLSKVCHQCKKQESKPDDEQKHLWEQDHKGNCKANYKGSASAMETKGVKKIFTRSRAKHKLRYTEYYGDGDGKGFEDSKDTYEDEDIEVVKKECIGHIQKRVGTALRKKKKEVKGLGGKGRLTDAFIDKLQNYYGIAIRSNVDNVKEMKRAISASFNHCISSDKRPLHDDCPDGPTSWCGYKRDRANKTNLFKPGKGLPDEVIKEIKPVFVKLSADDLLSKCLHGKTQNQNESINGMIWERVPKGVFVGSDVLRLGVHDAIANFNIGSKASLKILKEQGIEPGTYCVQELNKIDHLRVQKSNYKGKDDVKKRRKILRAKRKKKDDVAQSQEGLTYASGSF